MKSTTLQQTENIATYLGVAIDGVWIDDWIY
jgi:hypothetical protein